MRCEKCKALFTCHGKSGMFKNCEGFPNEMEHSCQCQTCYEKGLAVIKPASICVCIPFKPNPKIIGGYKIHQER